MPGPIRSLAERHLYEPEMIKVKAATLTIDTVEQFYLETKAQDKVDALGACWRPRSRRRRSFRAHEIVLSSFIRTLRDKGMNVRRCTAT